MNVDGDKNGMSVNNEKSSQLVSPCRSFVKSFSPSKRTLLSTLKSLEHFQNCVTTSVVSEPIKQRELDLGTFGQT